MPANHPSEVVSICSDLIRIDSYNVGGIDGATERTSAEYVAELLTDAGLEPRLFESEPGRASVVARVSGRDPLRPALLLHCHLDVVPAVAEDWTLHPLSGEVHDGMVWGRGAVDMKNMCAMVLAVVRQWARDDVQPDRDIVLAFFADEETGSKLGAHWMARNHPDLFEGCTEAVGEVGGFSYTVADDVRLYPIMTAEKGKAWMRVTAKGRAGHGSMLNSDNAVVELSDAISRLGHHQFPLRMTASVRDFLAAASTALGVTLDEGNIDQNLERLGTLAPVIGATLRNTANPSVLQAGTNVNVLPHEAVAYVDGRFLPGFEDEFHAQITEVLGPDVHWELVLQDIAIETSFDGQLVDAMSQALRAEDPGAVPLPYMTPAGTDAKALAPLGMRCFGFSPLRLPSDLDFGALFHGVDERVPVDALIFGERVLRRFLMSA